MKSSYRSALALITVGVFANVIALQSATADDRRLERMAHRLELNSEQVEAIRSLNEYAGVSKVDRRAMRLEVQSLIEAGQVDAAADLAASNARESTYSRAERRTAMSEILTPEQFEKWSATRERRSHGHRRNGRP